MAETLTISCAVRMRWCVRYVRAAFEELQPCPRKPPSLQRFCQEDAQVRRWTWPSSRSTPSRRAYRSDLRHERAATACQTLRVYVPQHAWLHVAWHDGMPCRTAAPASPLPAHLPLPPIVAPAAPSLSLPLNDIVFRPCPFRRPICPCRIHGVSALREGSRECTKAWGQRR
jgi:hypothetical protein